MLHCVIKPKKLVTKNLLVSQEQPGRKDGRCLIALHSRHALLRQERHQWSFRKTGTMGMLTSQAEIGVWVQAPGPLLWRSRVSRLRNDLYCVGWGVKLDSLTPQGITPGKMSSLSAKSCNLENFGQKMVRSAVYSAFLNTLTVRTPFPCVLAAFQQWEHCFHAFPLK